MSSIERDPHRIPGPRFERDEAGRVMFAFVMDSVSVLGPRPATKADKQTHAGAWQAFVDEDPEGGEDRTVFNGADPAKFDHDGDGEAGGSLSKEQIVAELKAKGVKFDARKNRDALAKLLRDQP